jgi:hypothetical protein
MTARRKQKKFKLINVGIMISPVQRHCNRHFDAQAVEMFQRVFFRNRLDTPGNFVVILI